MPLLLPQLALPPHCLCARLQFAQLLRLQRLKLEDCWYSANSLSPLSALAGSLTRLDVCGSYEALANLPAELSVLSQLQHLECWCMHNAHAVWGALPHLVSLTCLVRCACLRACAAAGCFHAHQPSKPAI